VKDIKAKAAENQRLEDALKRYGVIGIVEYLGGGSFAPLVFT
jgi:hypothetical protein